MSKRPLISVIIPVYNVAEFLSECLDSILTQTYDNLEIILIDDDSTDDSGKIMDQYAKQDSRIQVFHTENHGPSAARNLGIEQSTGSLITFVDSDDYLDKDYLEYLYELLSDDNADISCCLARLLVNGTAHQHTAKLPATISYTTDTILADLLVDQFGLTNVWAKLYRRELFNEVRFPIGQFYEDLNTSYNLYLLAKNIILGTDAKYNYRKNLDSITQRQFSKKDFDLIKAVDTVTKDLEANHPELKKYAEARELINRLLLYHKMILADYRGPERAELLEYFKSHQATFASIPSCEKLQKVVSFIVRRPQLYEQVIKSQK